MGQKGVLLVAGVLNGAKGGLNEDSTGCGF